MQLRRLCLTLLRDPEVASTLASVFGTALVERGFEKKKDKKGVVYYDIRVLPDFGPALPAPTRKIRLFL